MTATAHKTALSISPALALSGALHGALVLVGVWWVATASPVIPLGRSIEVAMIDLPAAEAPAAPAPKPVASAAPTKPALQAMAIPNKAPKQSAEKPVEQAAAPAPVATAAKAAGPIGEATGRADVGEMDRYLYELRVTLETRKTYPTLSRRLREAGEVMVEFRVKKDGSFDGVNIVKQSEFARLNDAAVQLVASLGRFRPIPDGAGRAELSVKLPIRYALE